MYKVIDAGSWDSLESQGIANIMPFLKSGSMTGKDQRAFFRKTAASEQFLHDMGNIKLGDGDIPVHLNAIGATEWAGPNRKGDAFSEQTCRDWHHTFVTEGRNYVHHRNNDPKISFGKIASSCYNENMHRIELLVVSNGSKAAAKRNGGLVLPDEFLSRLEKNAAVPVSMGCYIRNDTCSICGNQARTRSEYCDSTTCRDPKTGEYFPGCKNGLMKIASDGRIQYVDNIEPRFFDISYVGVPADRTGYGFRADYLEKGPSKTASVDPSFSAEDYLGIQPFRGWAANYKNEMMAMLGKLAAYEQTCSRSPEESRLAFGVYALSQNPTLGAKLASMLPTTRMAAIRLLSHRGVLLSPENFGVAFQLEKSAGCHIRECPGIFTNAYARYHPCHPEAIAAVLAAIDQATDTKLAEMWLPQSLIDTSIMTHGSIASNVTSGLLQYATKKQGSLYNYVPQYRGVAEAYAIYKTAALCRFPPERKDFGIKLAVWQNF